MTNMGFNKFCDENGLNFEATAVGDRYVLENMLKNNYKLGGEQSGHVIFLDHGTTGDGQLTGVQLLSIVKRSGKTLSQLAGVMKRFPQVLINVKVAREQKDNYKTDEVICAKIAQTEKDLNGRGRVLVRPSGTEPLIRVMLEGESIDEIKAAAEAIADTINTRLN